MDSQNKQILAHLKQGWSITPAEAYERFGCLRLAARIHNLKEDNLDISTTMIEVSPGTRVARYKLIGENQ